jgi:hypothetical protein
MENITVCLAPGFTESLAMHGRPGSIKPADNAAFGGQPQGYGLTPELAEMPGDRAFRPTSTDGACTVAASWPTTRGQRLTFFVRTGRLGMLQSQGRKTMALKL